MRSQKMYGKKIGSRVKTFEDHWFAQRQNISVCSRKISFPGPQLLLCRWTVRNVFYDARYASVFSDTVRPV